MTQKLLLFIPKALLLSKALLMNVRKILNRPTENVKRDNAKGISFTANREKIKDTLNILLQL